MDQNMRQQHMFRREYFGKSLAVLCGMFLIVLTIAIGAFLLAKGMLTFTQFHHSIGEFLFSSAWKPSDTEMGGGQVGAAIYIWGSILTCTLALVISVPFSLATAVFMTQIAPKLGERIIRPAVEIFVGIPSVVYGWVGLVVLVPLLQRIFDLPHGQSVLAAGIVLSVMIYPTITSVSADAIRSVNNKQICRRRLRTWFDTLADDLQSPSPGCPPRHPDRYRPRPCKSLRRSTCGFHGYRQDESIPGQPPGSDKLSYSSHCF